MIYIVSYSKAQIFQAKVQDFQLLHGELLRASLGCIWVGERVYGGVKNKRVVKVHSRDTVWLSVHEDDLEVRKLGCFVVRFDVA